jgi:hypothetical protein
MAKRRTSGIQRRERASADALNKRLDAGSGMSLPDWRLLAIGGVLAVGLILIVLVAVLGGGPDPNAGVRVTNDGQTHVNNGASCRANPSSCGLSGDPYSSLPATSGPHWNTPNNWGVYDQAQEESQLIHNLEHGGIVIWYEPDEVETADVDTLAQLVRSQVSQGIGGRYKFILSPWGGAEPLPSPIVVTAWTWMLELETADTGAIDAFASEHYGLAPEPNGGPGPS